MAAEFRNQALPRQEAVAKFYNTTTIQVGVAVLIGANFLTNIVEKEVDPKGEKHEKIFEAFNYFYNIAFTIELIINLYGHWWCPFWKSGWNVFDAVVVTIGLVNMMNLNLPSAFGMLRMMRAFRVFRLFKRVKSLNKIIVAIVHAIPGVSNAFLILGIVMSIYSILAVELWTHMAEDCNEPWGDKRWVTPRGNCWGPEYFGQFSKSFYTFFQVLTGDSWSEMVARQAIFYYYDTPIKAVGGALFFVSYVLITGFMLINVVVAVLLDKMSAAEVAEESVPGVPAVGDNGAGDSEAPKDDATNGVIADSNGPDTSLATTQVRQLVAVQEKVGQLMEERQRMRADLDAFSSDVSELKTKIKTIVELVSA